MKTKLNIKIKIDKAKANAITSLAIASFLLVFGLFTSKTLLGFYVYQGRVLSTQKTSISNIAQDQQVANSVENSYTKFINQQFNIIGGASVGNGSASGNNAKIILDALPQTYDFPALMSSIQALFTIPGITVESLTGTDNSLSLVQSSQPLPIPLSFSVQGSYTNIQNFLSVIKRSVSPIDILTIQLSGTDTNLTASITAQIYYYNPPSGIFTNTKVVQ
jgi:hypothetical protein